MLRYVYWEKHQTKRQHGKKPVPTFRNGITTMIVATVTLGILTNYVGPPRAAVILETYRVRMNSMQVLYSGPRAIQAKLLACPMYSSSSPPFEKATGLRGSILDSCDSGMGSGICGLESPIIHGCPPGMTSPDLAPSFAGRELVKGPCTY